MNNKEKLSQMADLLMRNAIAKKEGNEAFEKLKQALMNYLDTAQGIEVRLPLSYTHPNEAAFPLEHVCLCENCWCIEPPIKYGGSKGVMKDMSAKEGYEEPDWSKILK